MEHNIRPANDATASPTWDATSPLPCSFCKHNNPLDAKFCNECGAQLTLKVCTRCDAVNHRVANACYKCDAEFEPYAWEPGAEEHHGGLSTAPAPSACTLPNLQSHDHRPLPEAAADAFQLLMHPALKPAESIPAASVHTH